MRGDVGVRLRQIVRTIGAELEVEILKGHVSADHVHLFVSSPPHVSASYMMQRIIRTQEVEKDDDDFRVEEG